MVYDVGDQIKMYNQFLVFFIIILFLFWGHNLLRLKMNPINCDIKNGYRTMKNEALCWKLQSQ